MSAYRRRRKDNPVNPGQVFKVVPQRQLNVERELKMFEVRKGMDNADLENKARAWQEPATIAYHGTRIPESIIREQGLVPPGGEQYKNWIREALEHFNIPWKEALKDPVIKNEIDFLETSGIPNAVWVSTSPENAYNFAVNSPEKVSVILEQFIPKEQVRAYLDERFGTPKLITITALPEFGIRQHDINKPIKVRVPPKAIEKVEAQVFEIPNTKITIPMEEMYT